MIGCLNVNLTKICKILFHSLKKINGALLNLKIMIELYLSTENYSSVII